jgi:hypothetical protein
MDDARRAADATRNALLEKGRADEREHGLAAQALRHVLRSLRPDPLYPYLLRVVEQSMILSATPGVAALIERTMKETRP